jgi:hypothetical protein
VKFHPGYTPAAGTALTVSTAKGVHGRFDSLGVPGFKTTPICNGASMPVQIDAAHRRLWQATRFARKCA